MDWMDAGLIASVVLGSVAGIGLQAWWRRRRAPPASWDGVALRVGGLGRSSNFGDDAFVSDLRILFRRRLTERAFAVELYAAIARVTWTHQTKGHSGFGPRAALYVLTELGSRWDLDGAATGCVSEAIEAALFDLGWHHQAVDAC